jgi:transposase-like protein
MQNETTTNDPIIATSWETLEDFARRQIQSWLQEMLEEEVSALLGGRNRYERREGIDPASGYRNGHGKPRKVAMTCGTVTVRRPRVRGLEERFESRILPLFKRRTTKVADLVPELYLHGLAKRDFELALRGLLGDAAPLSASSVARLKEKWQAEYAAWRKARLPNDIVYLWADGIYVKAGLDKEKACLLVVVGARSDGTKAVLAVESGYRESKDSWLDVLRMLKSRGMNVPALIVADGALGLWSAVADLGWRCFEQRCWNHKIRNVLDALPKSEQEAARLVLCRIPYADTREDAEALRDQFVADFGERYQKAVTKLTADWDRMVAFYAMPKEHWRHLRTTNVVESPFHAVRLRTRAAKRFKRVDNATAVIWKTLLVAQKTFRKLNGAELLPAVLAGRTYVNGLPAGVTAA